MGMGMSDLYLRQRKLPIKLPECVVVVGTGGIGTWVALFFAMAGVKHLILVDPDDIEIHNLNRIPFPPETEGAPKVKVLGYMISTLRPEAIIVPMNDRFEDIRDELEMLLKDFKEVLVVDAVDNTATSEAVREWASKNGFAYLDVKYNGFKFSIRYAKDAKKVPSSWEGVPQSYTDVAYYVVTAVIPSALAVLLATATDRESFYVYVPDMRNLLGGGGNGA